MKKKKLNLENIKEFLSRDEMKKIMAGSGGDCNVYCHQDAARYCKVTCTSCTYESGGPGDWICT